MRVSQNQGFSTQPIDFGAASDTQYFPLGTIMHGNPSDTSGTANVSNGYGKFIYGKGSSTIVVGAPVQFDKDFLATAVPNTAGTGAPVVFSCNLFSATNLYGWFCESGIVPAKVSIATAAAAPTYITGAGTIGTTQAAGKQILSFAPLLGSTAAFTRTVVTKNGSPVVKVSGGLSGMFAGLTPSGTGIPASTIIAVDHGKNEITLSANCTASGSVTGTFTHTGYVVAAISSPHVQGQIL